MFLNELVCGIHGQEFIVHGTCDMKKCVFGKTIVA
jgi:hypothetical protein